MKANRVKWDDMWEKYFENYTGWTTREHYQYTKEAEKNSYTDMLHEKTNEINETADDVLDEVYRLREPETLAEEVGQEVQKSEYQSEEHVDIHSFLNAPLYDTSEKYYPADEYMGSVVEESDTPLIEIDSKYYESNKKAGEKGFQTEHHIPDGSEKKNRIVRSKTIYNQPDKIIFECSTGQGFAFDTPDGKPLAYTPVKTCIPKTLGTISIDTSCLKRPSTKVMFTCNIFFIPKNMNGTAQLEFVLYRSCNGNCESMMGNWVFDVIDKKEKLSQIFRLSFCSSNCFPGFCTYFVRVIPVYIKNCTVCLTNCHLNAVAQ